MDSETILAIDNSFWGTVEVMGRRVYNGKISVEALGGAGFIRVDVPATPEHTRRERGYFTATDSPDAACHAFGVYDVTYPVKAGSTHLIGAASVYAIHPKPEEFIRAVVAREHEDKPISVKRVPEDEVKRLEASGESVHSRDTDEDEDDDEDDADAIF